ncbi:MAG: hypothetical protein EOM06_07605 [Sphingobacteriia bacterium]|nr:hypothetical protein [Sphingobacteriia bacterium]
MTGINLKEQLIDLIKKDFIGPDPVQKEGFIQENGEEILFFDSPLKRYSAGILFPQKSIIDELADSDQEPEFSVDPEESKLQEDNQADKFPGYKEWVAENEEIMNLSNAYRQSAISMTISLSNDDEPVAHVYYATYKKEDDKYYRIPHFWDNGGKNISLPNHLDRIRNFSIEDENGVCLLELVITYRGENDVGATSIFTISLINRRTIGGKSDSLTYKTKDCYFQVCLKLISNIGFSPLPEGKRTSTMDEDYLSNQLLYRNVKNYSIGHGCSAEWTEEEKCVTSVETAIIPKYEIKPILPSKIEGSKLEMYNLSDSGDFSAALTELDNLCESYRIWISKQETDSYELEEEYVETADRHIRSCLKIHERMTEGVNLLKYDSKIRKAFQYMNRAMLLQQLHYSLPLNEWTDNGSGFPSLVSQDQQMPDIDDPSTWYNGDQITYGIWRPFQLAFILINLRSMADKTSDDRKIVDLIWFPTGGGKTEAYLGLSAYTIFIRKLMNQASEGTAIIMRYTLRLLSAQQYDRASAMICACESIRRDNPEELGNSRITIGMWVGGETTPNKQKDALEKFRKINKEGLKDEYPFVILKCPWCGSSIGPVSIRRSTRIQGIISDDKKIRFQCSNKKCAFSSDQNPLPMTVIDEDIYESPSTLIIGTVDKFAMLPYLPVAQSIFGIKDGVQSNPPDLIIQDELHLISGPLGSMVGHYETLVNDLCQDRSEQVITGPKIIASTATISRAKEQCHALYDRSADQIVQFPPSGLNAGDSFFSYQDNERPGRTYVGILASAASSYSTGNIRLHAALLYAAKALEVNEEKERDPYWTVLGYFNSLRELGQTATWISADIEEYLQTMYLRRRAEKEEGYKEKRRYIYRYEELTSRIPSTQIPAALQRLGIRYPSQDNDERPIDICLATNMISVGVDVSRLGLMTVTGQPKTTAEYIQATSRVGRAQNAPGVVFVSYSTTKPRDRSHYEHFRSYHSRIYSHVEPSSVTPFSAPLRKRAIHALLIGLVRLNGNKNTYDNPRIFPADNKIEEYKKTIIGRIDRIESDEVEDSKRKLEEILKHWKEWAPAVYSEFPIGTTLPLMIQAGSGRQFDWEGAGFETPMSMRSTDVNCEIKIITSYTEEEGEHAG